MRYAPMYNGLQAKKKHMGQNFRANKISAARIGRFENGFGVRGRLLSVQSSSLILFLCWIFSFSTISFLFLILEYNICNQAASFTSYWHEQKISSNHFA